LDPNDFADLMEAMLRANAEKALKAFAAALKDGIPEKSECWRPNMKKRPAAA
jgi:hypothetical protein